MIVELLNNNDMIRSEREKARGLRNKFVGISNEGRNSGFGNSSYDNNYSSGNMKSKEYFNYLSDINLLLKHDFIRSL